jgi:hypothetical protein
MEFDSLERKTLLSSLHPAMGHESHVGHPETSGPPMIVRETMQSIRAHGFDPTKQVIAVPGSFTDYEITFMVGRSTVTIDINVPAPPSPGPEPTPG